MNAASNQMQRVVASPKRHGSKKARNIRGVEYAADYSVWLESR
jgi:hypothetical protein